VRVRVDPGRAAAALTRAYEGGEKYADVRGAVVSCLPRVKDAANFVLECVECLASPPSSTNPAPAASSSSVPLIQLLLEALSQPQGGCVVPAPRPVFAATDGAATEVTDPVARARAAEMLVRTVRGAVAAARGQDGGGGGVGGDKGKRKEDDRNGSRAEQDTDGNRQHSAATPDNSRRPRAPCDSRSPRAPCDSAPLLLAPRAVARLAAAVGLNVDDLRAVDGNGTAAGTKRPRVHHTIHSTLSCLYPPNHP
jgi:hypothetical protein